MNKYTTIQGDTWDLIAYKLWQSEYLFPLLMEANPKHIDTVIFPGGVVLNVPDFDEIEEPDDIEITERPPWLEEDDDL